MMCTYRATSSRQDKMMASSTLRWKVFDRRMNQREKLAEYPLSLINGSLPRLASANSCAMIGCGCGHLEMEFVGRCLPNLKLVNFTDYLHKSPFSSLVYLPPARRAKGGNCHYLGP